MKSKKTITFGIGLALGAILGTVAGLLLSPQSGKKNRLAIKKSLEKLKKYLDEHQVPEKFAGFLKSSSELTRAYFAEIKHVLAHRLQELKAKTEKIDLEQYTQLVDESVKIAQKKYGHIPKTLHEVRGYFVNLFETKAEDLIEHIKDELKAQEKNGKEGKKRKLSA